jgi:Zn-dependent peptidase ImmA (M78 family)
LTNERLLSYAEMHGYEVDCIPMSENNAFTIERKGFHIVLSTELSPTEEKEAIAHELGHCAYGGTYNRYSPYETRSRAEYRANKWAYYRLVPPGELREALKCEETDLWSLAEQFDVSCQFMKKVLDYYALAGIV